jgi:hypothetical protein
MDAQVQTSTLASPLPNGETEKVTMTSDRALRVSAVGGTVTSTTQLSTAFSTGQQAVTATAAKLNGGTSTSFSNGVILKNLSTSSASLFYGGSGVTTSTGCEIPPGGSDVLPVSDISSVYVIAAVVSTSTASWAGLS